MPDNENLISEAFVLAGGKSSRIGSDKAQIRLGTQTFLERAIRAVSQARPGKITIIRAFGTSPAVDPFSGYGIIPDIVEGRGAPGGVLTALSAGRGDLAIVLACDLPFAGGDLLLRLKELMRDPEFDCAVPVSSEGRAQPLCAVYRTEPCLKAFEVLLEEKDLRRSMDDLLDSLKVRYFEFVEYAAMENSEHILLNVNTPGELELARNIAGV